MSRVSHSTRMLLSRSIRKVKQVGGRVSKKIGLDSFSEQNQRAIVKILQDREMSKYGKAQTKKALEYVFCVVNESNLFNEIQQLIE